MLKSLTFIFMTIALCSCSSLSVDVDYDDQAEFSKLSKFSWLTSKSAIGEHPSQRQPFNAKAHISSSAKKPFITLQQKRIQKKISQKLIAMGFSQDAQPQADFLIRFKLVTYERQKIYGNDFAYSNYYRHRGFYNWQARDYDIYYYDEGSLTIEIIDPDMKQVIWMANIENISRSDLKNNSPYFDKALEEALSQFPPQPSL